MSVHFEAFNAQVLAVTLLHRGDVYGEDEVSASHAIAFGDGSSAVVIEGELDELRVVLTRMLGSVLKAQSMEGHPTHLSIVSTPAVHKAEPWGRTMSCRHCRQRIKRIPGGNGAIWVHADSGAVAGSGPPKGAA